MGPYLHGLRWLQFLYQHASLRKEKSKRKIPSFFQEYFLGYCMHYFQLHPTGQNSFMCFYLLVTWNSLSCMATKLAKNQGFYYHWEELLLLGKTKYLSQTPQLLLLWFLLFSIVLAIVFLWTLIQKISPWSSILLSLYRLSLGTHSDTDLSTNDSQVFVFSPCLSIFWRLHLDNCQVKPIIIQAKSTNK